MLPQQLGDWILVTALLHYVIGHAKMTPLEGDLNEKPKGTILTPD